MLGPSYKVAIYGNGQVEFDGPHGVPSRGTHLGTVSQQTIHAIVDAMNRAGFLSIDDKSFIHESDVPYTARDTQSVWPPRGNTKGTLSDKQPENRVLRRENKQDESTT